MNKQIEKKCKDCLHYKMCLERFRKLKKENHYILIDENEYFAHADDCEFHIKSTDVVRKIFEEIEREIVAALQSNYRAKQERVEKQIADDFVSYMIEGKISALRGIDGFIAELKKKYESEGADDE